MSIGSYLKNKQPLLSKSFSYALTHDQVAHSYLISGEAGTPLKETALFLAKSLLCDHPDPFADEECVTCTRIDQGDYPDFVLLDGEEESIKKETVLATVNLFQKTPLERKGIMVYVIHLVENMTPEAVNSLLKFLEEPNSYTYAFLTTENEDRVLPTILSRCEKLRLVLTPRSEVYQEALMEGVDKSDAEMLSHFYNNPSILKEKATEPLYVGLKVAIPDYLDAMGRNFGFAHYVAEKELTPLLNSKSDARFFFDVLTLFYRDIVSMKSGNPIHLETYDRIIREAAKKLPHPENSLLAIMTLRGEIELNIKSGLLLAHLTNILAKE